MSLPIGWGSFRLQAQAGQSCVAAIAIKTKQTENVIENPEGTMKNIKFVVKVNRGGAHAPQYVLRVDRLPIQTTTDRKLALVMGRFTAEDAVKSMQNSHCNPELVSVRVSA